MTATVSRRVILSAGGALTLAGLLPGTVRAQAATAHIGEPAPPFAGFDVNGTPVRLGDLKGKTVVLEWTNHGCPFVRKHYDSGNMQCLQADATGRGVVWLSVISSAPGQQGHVSPAEAKARMATEKWAATTLILDPAGTIGRAYGAKTTPHMFIIDADGRLRYDGAIDDRPTAEVEDIPGARNYVREALDAVMTGKDVTASSTRAYGCAVKYTRTAT